MADHVPTVTTDTTEAEALAIRKACGLAVVVDADNDGAVMIARGLTSAEARAQAIDAAQRQPGRTVAIVVAIATYVAECGPEKV